MQLLCCAELLLLPLRCRLCRLQTCLLLHMLLLLPLRQSWWRCPGLLCLRLIPRHRLGAA